MQDGNDILPQLSGRQKASFRPFRRVTEISRGCKGWCGVVGTLQEGSVSAMVRDYDTIDIENGCDARGGVADDQYGSRTGKNGGKSSDNE